jgi:hypothetical protein
LIRVRRGSPSNRLVKPRPRRRTGLCDHRLMIVTREAEPGLSYAG